MSKNNLQKPKLCYSMIIEWSDEDNAFIVTVPELSGCRTHGSTYEEAVQQGQDAIETWLDGAEAWGNKIPAPKTFVYWEPFHPLKDINAAQDSTAKSRSA